MNGRAFKWFIACLLLAVLCGCANMKEFGQQASRNSDAHHEHRQSQNVADSGHSGSTPSEGFHIITREDERRYSYLTVDTEPRGVPSQIYVNDERFSAGVASPTTMVLRSNVDHTIAVEAKGFKPCVLRVRLSGQERRSETCRLVAARSP